MESQQFQNCNCDLFKIQKGIEVYFVGKGYLVTNFHKDLVYLTQATKKELSEKCIIAKILGNYAKFEIILGMSNRISNIDSLPTELESIPLSTKLLLKEPFLEKDFWNFVHTNVDLGRYTYRFSEAIPPQQVPVVEEREIVTEIEIVYCRYCGAKNNAMLTNCTQCGAKLN